MPKKSIRPRRRRSNPDPIHDMIDALNSTMFDAITQSMDRLMSGMFYTNHTTPNEKLYASIPGIGPKKAFKMSSRTPPLPPAPQHTLYDVLQVSPSADPETISAAYRSLAKRFHPDVYKGSDGDSRMKAITTAYQILSNPQSRKKYDQSINTTKRS